MTDPITLRDLELCFEGAVPAVIATAAADGTPNITYLSRVRMVDDERVALSNQFFSKTSRNLAENPRASMLLVHPVVYDMFRLTLAYERTERRGAVFERLREDVDAVAALQGMQDVFKLRAADVYRVLHIEKVPTAAGDDAGAASEPSAADVEHAARLAELSARLSRCPDLDTLVSATVDGLCELLGYEHSLLLLVDEQGKSLYTIASKGYDAQGVGSEIPVGEGIIGMAAARCTPMRLGNLRHMSKYSQTVRRSYEDEGHISPGREIPLPGLPLAQSRVAVPAMAFGQLVGVLVVESADPVAFTATDEAVLTVVASVVANAIEVERTQERAEDVAARQQVTKPHVDTPAPAANATHVRFFGVDGSTFLDGDYLIKGVSGRILWSLLRQHDQEGRTEFTNREVRLDPALELPEFRDNFESRLILLKRRLDERGAPIRIEKTGRGRFRLEVEQPLRLEQA
jgi:predicted pyridoxine 5'-phosphate oxidase superfamily flavin-nucleotide-binding protein